MTRLAANDPLLEEAAEWIVRVNDASATQSDFTAWQAWLAASPRHAQAYEQMQDIWMRSGAVARTSAAATTTSHAVRRPTPRRWAQMAAAAALAALSVALLLWVRQHRATTIETATAELRSIKLPDGSRAALGPETRIQMRYTENARAIAMASGEAFFEAVHDPVKPFYVLVGGHRVTALGTAFAVNATPGRLEISVTDGAVRLDDTAIIRAGERLVQNRGGSRAEPPAPMRSRVDAAAWRNGKLEYEDEPLGVVISDLNRYSTTKILLDDPSIASMRYSGTVFPDQPDAWLESIRGVFPVEVATRPDGRRVVRLANGSGSASP